MATAETEIQTTNGIRIGDYVLSPDSHNWTLYKVATVQATPEGTKRRGRAPKAENIGTERLQPIGYYPRLDSALSGFFDKRVKDKIGERDLSNVHQLAEMYDEVRSEIMQAVAHIHDPLMFVKADNTVSNEDESEDDE